MSDVVIYEDGSLALNATVEGETVWLNQKQMSELFDKSKKTISEHIGNVFKESELMRDSVVRKFRTTASDGKSYSVDYYSLDVIISVGYRVKSKRGTQFRIWANKVLYATEVASPEAKPQGAATLVAESIEIDKNLLGLGYAI